jgi:hypothetical protein
VLLSTPLHASSNFTVSVQLANKRGFTKKKVLVIGLILFAVIINNNCDDLDEINEKLKLQIRSFNES